MYVSKKNNISIWDNNRSSYHSEKTQLPPPPPVPPHRTPPPATAIHTPSSQLMRCTSMPYATKPTTTFTMSDSNTNTTTTTTTSVPARPMSWHPIPSRRSSRFCHDDPEIKAKLDRIAQSDRLLSLRTRIMHS